MKKILLILCTICTLHAHAQWDDYYVPNGSDALKEDLKGPVKYAKITEWNLKVKFGKPEKELFEFQREYDYDKRGMLLKRLSSSERMKYIGTSKNGYIYNKAGLLTEVTSVHDGKSGNGYRFIYDEKGRLKDKDVPDGNKLLKKIRYRYDNAGNLISITKYNGEGKYQSKRVFEWNEKNQLVERTDYDLKEDVVETYLYSYDSKGNIYEQKNITPRYYFYTRFTYNAANQKIKESTTLDRKQETIKESIYDPTYEYDEKGNLAKTIKYGGKEITTYTYTYDARGNWITKLITYPDELRNGEPKYQLVEREIKYW